MSAQVNPTNMNVTATKAAAEGVTAFKVTLGTKSGGPYDVSAAVVPTSGLTPNNGVYTVPMAAIAWNPPLVNGTTYFAVEVNENAAGGSPASPEASFSVVSVPSASEALSFT